MNSTPPDPHLHPPLHINVHSVNAQMMTTNQIHSPTSLLTINKVETFPEVSSPPRTPPPPMPTALPTTVFQHLSPNLPSFHKQLPPPTTSIQQELFADQSVNFQTDSESEDEMPIKSEPPSPIRIVETSPDNPTIQAITDTPSIPVFTTQCADNGFLDATMPPSVNPPLITVQVIKKSLTPPPQPIKHEAEVNIVPRIFEIKSEMPTINAHYTQPPVTIHMPQYGGTVKAATLSDLEGIDMMHLPVDLDDSGNIDLLNEIDVEAIEVTEIKPSVLLKDSHSSFFALIRDIFCATVNHRTTVDHLNSIISGWLANPITALNDWYVEAENWLTLIPSAIQFLAGEVLEQPEDYVPYVEYKPQLLIYQWIGAGRDSDQHLNPLCDFWLQRRNELGSSNSLGQSVITQSTETGHRIAKTNSSGSTEGEEGTHNTERLSSPLPPRCPTGWTVVKANDMEIDEFRKQERRRFENPHLSFTYRLHGYESVVGPVKGIYTQIPVHSKARGHNMLTLDRPTFVTILTLVRDATARLPNGEGTRSEICQLLRSSQYISPDASDSVLQTIVSGALDRMHTEHDPCVRYDPKRKIWIYLHRNRNEEEFEKMHQQFQGVSKHKKQSSRKMKSKSLIKSPISAAISGPSNSVSPVSSKGAVLFSSAPSIAMLPPLSIVSSPTISSPLPSSPLITTPIVTVQSPQPQSKPQPQQSKHQTLQPKPQTPQPNDPVTQNPLQATVLPPATIPSPITPIISPVSVQPKPQQIPPPQQLINKLHTPKKSVVKVEINSIKPITNMQKIEKTDQTSVNDFAGSDGQAIPIIIGQAKLVPATNQPILPQQIMAQRVISANIENKTITAKKSNKVIVPSTSILAMPAQPQPSIHVVQPHGVAHSVQPHAIQQAQRMQQVSSPTIKIAQQPIQTQLPQIQQVSSPTIKIAQQPPHSQLTQTSINTPITSIKPTYNTVTASNLSFSNITPKSSIIKTTMIQPPSTSITMSAQPQQSILIQNHNNRVPTQMFVPSNAITTTKKVNKPPLLVQQQQQQPQQTINQNFVIPINISTQSIVQTQKATTSLANQQQVVQPVKPVLRTTAVPIQSSATHKPGMSLLQQNQPAKSVARASITSGKSLLSPSVAAANMTFQQQKQLQKTQTLLPSNIVPIQGKVSLPTSTAQSVIIPKIVSTATKAKGQPTTLTPAQQRLILQNIIAQQKQQKQQRANAGNSINLVTSTPLVSTANTQHQPMHMKNVIVSQQNSSNFMQRIIASSAATSMVISTTPASQQSTITSHASSGLTPKPTSTANSLINRQIIQIQQNNAQPTNQPKPPLTNATLAKVQTVSTSNLTPQQQQNLLQSIKQQQMRVQNQQANATPQQQTLMVKQQQVLQQIQKQLQHQQNNAISSGTSLLSQSPGTIISTPTSSNQSTLTSSSSSSNISAPTQSVTRIIRPGIIRHQPFIQTVSSTPVTSTTSTLPTNMTKVLSNTTGQIISLESLLQKQGQSIGSGTTLRVAGTKPGQANIIQLASGSGSAMAQYAIVSQGPQGRSMISLTSTPQRLVNTQSVATTTTSSLQSFAGTTLLKTVAESPPRTTNSAPSIVQQPKLVQPSSLTKVIGIQSVTSSGGSRNRPNATTAIRMMNTSNLNIAQIAGKPVIISSKPNGPQAQTNTSTSRQNVVWQNPTPLNNAPPKLTNSSFVLADQAGKVQSNVVQQHFDQSTTSTSRVSVNSQAVMFGNQVVKIQPNTLAVNQSQQSTPAPHPKPTTQSTGNTSLLTQSGTTRTVVLGQTGQTIRVHSPAQSGVATSNNSMQGLPSMSTQHMAGGQGTKVSVFYDFCSTTFSVLLLSSVNT